MKKTTILRKRKLIDLVYLERVKAREREKDK